MKRIMLAMLLLLPAIAKADSIPLVVPPFQPEMTGDLFDAEATANDDRGTPFYASDEQLVSEIRTEIEVCSQVNCVLPWEEGIRFVNEPTPIPTPEPSSLFLVASGLSLITVSLLARKRCNA